MSNFETGYCSFDEYRGGEQCRVMEHELCIDGLYTVMFALEASAKQPAVKFPSYIYDVELAGDEPCAVHYRILHSDPAKDLEAHARLRDGYWLPAHSAGINVEGFQVIAGYFRDSGSGFDDEQELQDMITHSTDLSQELERSRELVLA